MRKTSQSEPVNNFLRKNIKRHPISFHMPGHKYGRFERSLSGRYDITEIQGADNIKNPKGILKASIGKLSGIYGSSYAFYLTNGTTSGIHGILHYASLTGGKIALSRDCHISAVNGAILFGVDVVFIPTEQENGIPIPAKPKAVETVLNENPDICTVLITSPNYYGMVAQIDEISGIIHKKGSILAIDEAHGAHFQFAGLGEKSGINNGADIVCHSLHKTLPVYNQGAVLHVCSDRINKSMITDSVNMLGTTSPSYPLIASMEKAVVELSANGSKKYSILKKHIGELKGLCGDSIIETDDYTRLVIKTNPGGFKASNLLHEKYSIDIESADFTNIICIATPYNKKGDFKKLTKALLKIGLIGNDSFEPDYLRIPGSKMSLYEGYSSKKTMVSLDMAEGRICGTIIVSYPPGTPLVCPGEIVDGYAVDYIKKVMDAGGSVLGINDGKIPVLE